ncbi:MAG: hypothetical protein V1897_05040, partial [Pseudomonadota bacterium]
MGIKDILRRTGTYVSIRAIDCASGFLINSHPEWNPRHWSNREILKYGNIYKGDVVNISAWKDGDKEGGRYRDYFPNAKSYTVTNFGSEMESSGYENEKELDLSRPYSRDLGKYDLVFSHTVLEHVFQADVAIDNLCRLSRDTIMTVVPFIQVLHWRGNAYRDYWRYSPFALQEIFEKRGFKTLYLSWNDDTPLMNVYLFHIASCRPDAYKDIFPVYREPDFLERAPGNVFNMSLWPKPEQTSLKSV